MISIVIPTCKSSNLIPCLESIKKYTEGVEVIVVCNGYDKYDAWDHTYKVLKFDQKIGYPAACNAGIRAAKGKFIVLLNDDTELLPQPKNQWLEMLHEPFKDPDVAITGPWMMHNTEIDKDFLCFFCCMIRRESLDKIGLLDEIFGAGYDEDVDLCCRAVASGYRIAQVPSDGKVPYDGRMGIGAFPIFHEGNNTFKNWEGGHELMAKNHAILRERYNGVTIANAQKLGEWMNDEELLWLARQSKKAKVVIELGSWFGKSSTAIADNLPEGGVVYCIDTWAGSEAEKDTNHVQARDMDGDFAYNEFCRNLWPHIQSGKLRTIRMHGRHAAKLLQDMGVKSDLVFIDAGHLKHEVIEDTHNFAPLMAEGGVISGHDYGRPEWPPVTEAVNELFGGNYGVVPGTTIWATNSKPIQQKRDIYECMIFNNEFEMLKHHLITMWDVVDRFVIVEATVNHAGKPKPLHFKENIEKFKPWLSKISHVVVEDSPPMGSNGNEERAAWEIERHQRDCISRALGHCKDSDIIVVVDCDEIPNPDAVKNFKGLTLHSLRMELFLYDYQVKAVDSWRHGKIIPYGQLKLSTPSQIRYITNVPDVENGGRHLSYFGGVDAIIEKIHNTAHRNIDTEEFTDRQHIQECITHGLDLFNRDIIYKVVKENLSGLSPEDLVATPD